MDNYEVIKNHTIRKIEIVENIVLLSKKHVNPKAYVEIGVDAEEYYKIKGNKH